MGCQKYHEKISVIRHNGELLFEHVESQKKIDLIVLVLLFIPCPKQKEYDIVLDIFRNGKIIDSGKVQYYNKDNEGFKLEKIIGEYWKSKDQNLVHCDFLDPVMFLEGDIIEITHSTQDSITNSMRTFTPSWEELQSQGLSNEEVKERMDQRIEIFPEVYRCKK